MLEAYHRHRPDMATGDLLLFSGRGFVPWAIKRISHGDVNHAALVLTIREYLDDRVMQIGAVGRGFIPTPLSDCLEHYTGQVYWLPLVKCRSLRKEIGREALKVSGTAYDYGSLFRNALGYVNVNAARLFCSEAVQYVCSQAGLQTPYPWSNTAARPADLEWFGWWGRRRRIL